MSGRLLLFLVAVTPLLQYRHIRFILLRRETLVLLVIILLCSYYIRSLLRSLGSLLRGSNLVTHDLVHQRLFRPPKFIDRGFSDLQLNDGLWHLQHQKFSYTASQGLRPYMEDRMHFVYDPSACISIFGIFDGHGGMYVSDYLECHFACSIRDRLRKFKQKRNITVASGVDPIADAIITEVCRLDDAISAFDPKFTSLTGSTLIAAILEENKFLTVVNVGDSRAVACDIRNRTFPLSSDHKPQNPSERRRIELAGGHVSEDNRVEGILAVSRSFGDTLLKRRGVLTAQPDVSRIDLSQKPLKFVIVATDGFWDVVSNPESVKLANQFLRRNKNWQRISSFLVREALRRGSQDNVSVLFLKLRSTSPEPIIAPYFDDVRRLAAPHILIAFDRLSAEKKRPPPVTFLSLLEQRADVMPSHRLCQLFRTPSNRSLDWTVALANDAPISQLNVITYAYIAPLIIGVGIVGDVLTVVTLTHPSLRKTSIIYTYLTLLAMTDLLTHLSVIPMVMWMLDIRACTAAASFFYAHIGFPLANALMGSSVWIVVFLTLSQFMAVCRPFAYGLRSRKVCLLLFCLAYIFNFCIYAPWAIKKEVHNLKEIVPELPDEICPYVVCDTTLPEWFMLYEGIRELISRVFPFFLVAFLNAKILITYRNTKRDRMERLANSQKRFVYEKSEKEEKRLFILLCAIIIIFFLCTIPAAPLTMLVADAKSNNLTFQIFRAVTNLLECTKFALNFYFYCLVNPDIRRICFHVVTCRKISRPPRIKGHAQTPLSQYTRSTKNSTLRGRSGSESRRSSGKDDYGSLRKDSHRKMTQPNDAQTLIEKLTVIKESESDTGHPFS